MAIRRSLRIAACIFLLSSAQAARDPAASADELRELRAKIERLQRDIAAAEKTRGGAAEELRESEKAVSEAHRALSRFVAASQAAGHRCVLVITGRGRLGSGILRSAVPRWLGEPDLRRHLLGIAPAQPHHDRREIHQHLVQRHVDGPKSVHRSTPWEATGGSRGAFLTGRNMDNAS